MDKDQRQVGVKEMQLAHQQKDRNDQRDRRQHVRADGDAQQEILARQAQPGQADRRQANPARDKATSSKSR